MGLKIMTKSKNRPTKWQFFHENHQLGKVVEMKRTDGSFVPVGFSRTETERLKNQSGKCEGSGGGSTG
jgi:nucleoid-associated protein YejK